MATDIDVRTIDNLDVDLHTAFARLRSHTPERASFLFEAIDRSGAAGRYSIIGYRVPSGAGMPPGQDVFDALSQELAALDRADSFAKSLVSCQVGFVSNSVANFCHGVRLCKDEGPGAMLNVGATIVLFDHQSGSVHIAGESSRIPRCLHELRNGPTSRDLPELDPAARPTAMQIEISDETLSSRANRLKPFFEEVDKVALTQTYVTPLATAEPFDMYRAQVALSNAKHGYFIDFGMVPMNPWMRIFGVSNELLFLRRRDSDSDDSENNGLRERLLAQLPHPSLTGSPTIDAAKAARRFEEESRQTFGGVVGYICPGAEAAFALADQSVYVQGNSIWISGHAMVSKETNPADVPKACQKAAAHRLAAVAAMNTQDS